MTERLLEYWTSLTLKEGTGAGQRPGASRWRRAVTDIATWVQCFAMYVSAMSSTHLKAVQN